MHCWTSLAIKLYQQLFWGMLLLLTKLLALMYQRSVSGFSQYIVFVSIMIFWHLACNWAHLIVSSLFLQPENLSTETEFTIKNVLIRVYLHQWMCRIKVTVHKSYLGLTFNHAIISTGKFMVLILGEFAEGIYPFGCLVLCNCRAVYGYMLFSLSSSSVRMQPQYEVHE